MREVCFYLIVCPVLVNRVKLLRMGIIRNPMIVRIVVPAVDVSMVAHGVRGMDVGRLMMHWLLLMMHWLLLMMCWLLRLNLHRHMT